MFLLFFYLFLALAVSFLCSIMESVLLSMTSSYIAIHEKKTPALGKQMRQLKTDIDQPLAAILSLNTVAHTVGAAGVGAQAMIIFGSAYISLISAILTLLILVLSEIIPKTLGALYWRKLAPLTTKTLLFLIKVLYPLVVLSKGITQFLAKGKEVKSVTREEVRALADLGVQEGLFLERESRILKNLMRFGSLKAESIMTPRPVMFILPEEETVGQVVKEYPDLQFSRIPIFEGSEENIRFYVLKNDIFSMATRENNDTPLRKLRREILIVPETVSLLDLFELMLDRREQIALVVDEYGGVEGLVTLEDIVETLIGFEIVDETDATTDMQVLARQRWYQRAQKLGLIRKKIKITTKTSSGYQPPAKNKDRKQKPKKK